jgi:hypothetical protein
LWAAGNRKLIAPIQSANEQPEMEMISTVTEGYPKLVAQEVAEAFLQDGPERLPGEVQLVRESALIVGQHLDAIGCPGDWSAIRLERLFSALDFMDEQALVGFSLSLIAIYGWLGHIGLVPGAICKQILGGVICHGPNVNFVRSLALSGQRMLSDLETTLH